MQYPSTACDELNPLLRPWVQPYGLPPFGHVVPAHFVPAFDSALVQHVAEIDAIAAHPDTLDFANTLATLDISGRLLDRITLLFHNLPASETSAALQSVQLEMAPRLAVHENAVFMHAGISARIDADAA